MGKKYYQESGITIYHGDCREILPQLEPVDLVLTDPPYGIGESRARVLSRSSNGSKKWGTAKATDYGDFEWDSKPVEYGILEKCIDMSQRMICFGGNYYPFPPSRCWLVWDKETGNDFADAELAWTNLDSAVRLKRYLWAGFRKEKPESRYHPTQKPLEVIAWALSLAPESCEIILDPFMGSGTTLRAAKDLGRKAIGIEIEEKYCEIAAKRLQQEVFDFGVVTNPEAKEAAE